MVYVTKYFSRGGGNSTSSVKITFINRSVLAKPWEAKFQVLARLEDTSQVPINNLQTISLSGTALSSDSTDFIEFDNKNLIVRQFVIRPMGITFAGTSNTNPISVETIYYNYTTHQKVYLDGSTYNYNTNPIVTVGTDLAPANSKYELEISV